MGSHEDRRREMGTDKEKDLKAKFEDEKTAKEKRLKRKQQTEISKLKEFAECKLQYPCF